MEEKNQMNGYEDEISIKELIQVLIKGKKIIIVITLIAIIASLVFSFFVVDESYEAKVMLLASPINSDIQGASDLSDISGLVTQYPDMSIETYIEEIKSSQLLKNTIVELALKGSDNELISVHSLLNMIQVSNIKDTNLLVLTVTSTDPEKAQLIANTLGENFIEYISEKNKAISFQAATIIEEKLVIEEKNLEEKSKAFVVYINENGDIKAIQNEVNTLLSNINSYQNSLITLEKEIESGSLALRTLLDNYDINITSDLINLDYTIGENFEILEAIKLDLSNRDNIQDALIQVEITKLETKLINNISNFTATKQKLYEIKQKYTAMQSILSENKIEYDKISREVSLASQAYNTYQEMHKEAIEASTSDIGRSSVIISSYAETPEYPSAPNKKLNLAIGAVLGLMLSAFVVFFKHMWES